MTEAVNIPEDIRQQAANALNVAEDMSGTLFCERVEVIAKTILAERERCASIADAHAKQCAVFDKEEDWFNYRKPMGRFHYFNC